MTEEGRWLEGLDEQTERDRKTEAEGTFVPPKNCSCSDHETCDACIDEGIFDRDTRTWGF